MTRQRLSPLPSAATARTKRRWPFAPTRRTAVLLSAGLLWVPLAWVDARAVVLMLAWNLFVLVFVIIDLWRLPRAGMLRVTRHWSGPLTIGHPVRVSLELHNAGTVSVSARLTDYLSPALSRELPHVSVVVHPAQASSARYDVTPRQRGDVSAGEVAIEWRSAWGLVDRWGQAATEQAVRVYPDLVEARRHSMFLIRTRQIALEKRRARRLAGGREFDRLREYRPGDERRDISWRVSARRGRPVTRLYQPERSQTVWLLVDAGRLLRTRTGTQTLLDRMTTAALALAQVAVNSGDNVGLVAYGRRIQHRLLPGRGPAHLRRLTEALAIVDAEPVEADHGAAAATFRGGQQRRALIVWMTEVAETAGVPDVIEYAMTLVPRHVVLFATMQQPELAAVSSMRPSTTTEMYRMVAAREALDRREALLRSLRHRGALVVETSPEGLANGVIDRYLEVKERGML